MRKNMKNLENDRPDIPGDVTADPNPAKPESEQPRSDAGQPALPAESDAAEKGNDPDSKGGPEVDARTAANRANSLKSTGAKTPAGREASSKNAAKHCLFAGDLSKHFRTPEEAQRYQCFIDGIVKGLAPVGDFEAVLARRAARLRSLPPERGP